jgi:hypothetical protein
MSYAGNRTSVFASFDEEECTWLPRIGQRNPKGSRSMLALVIEGFVMLGE